MTRTSKKKKPAAGAKKPTRVKTALPKKALPKKATKPRPRGPVLHPDGIHRCGWAGDDPLYVAYHDREWGVPERDDQALFEKLILDGFQAGLSWITILRKRDNFRRAFDDFDPAKIARYSDGKIETLMNDAGIIRNRAKITGTVSSAKAYLDIMKGGKGSFSNMLWAHVGHQPKVNKHKTLSTIPASSPQSLAMSKELVARGFKFVGPTIIYAFMQATGMINDHLIGCHCYATCATRKPPRPRKA